MRSVERYLELLSGNTVATTASAPSSLWILSAPTKLAPDEIPTEIPSVAASFCAIRIASPSFTADHGIGRVEPADLGVELIRDPLDAVPTRVAAGRVRRRLGGLEGMDANAAFLPLEVAPTPITVPPVPTPATNASGG